MKSGVGSGGRDKHSVGSAATPETARLIGGANFDSAPDLMPYTVRSRRSFSDRSGGCTTIRAKESFTVSHRGVVILSLFYGDILVRLCRGCSGSLSVR